MELIRKVLILMIKFYRKYISCLWPGKCRFYPTCSEYAIEAVSQYGALKGTYLSLRRILKCHPFHPGGYDPVCAPENKKSH